jgi:hypothetical protein
MGCPLAEVGNGMEPDWNRIRLCSLLISLAKKPGDRGQVVFLKNATIP